MPTTLITGSTGFIGSHLARAVARRGDQLRVLIRSATDDDVLSGIEFERINGDVTDRRAVRRAMEGADRVFHVAGMTSMRASDSNRVFEVNQGGSRIMVEEALAAGVERFVHTSSVAAIGPAPTGGRADETQPFTAGKLGIAYMNSKHEAEAEVLRAAARGLDAVIVNPTFVLGPGGGRASSMGLIRRFLLRRIPAYVDGGLNIVDVRDVADGHLLADAKAETGERYILGGRNFTLQRLFADLSRMSGVPAPQLKLPAQVAAAGARVSEQLGLPLGLAVDETRSAALWWTYSSAKAKRELGFSPRPHEETLEDALDAVSEELGDRVGGDPGAADSALSIAGRISRLAGRIPRP
ncbi:MAG: SDR family oxidoreductase [Acidobacteria bacterium]|nr:SDR family oxidoreductase [Acidobacteriota bacterium]